MYDKNIARCSFIYWRCNNASTNIGYGYMARKKYLS